MTRQECVKGRVIDDFLAGGQAALESRPADDRDEEIARLRAKVGELTMDNELLWLQHFATVADLVEALKQFKRRYNEQWLIERHGYRTPSQVRRDQARRAPAVA
jgi:hypothetical protein